MKNLINLINQSTTPMPRKFIQQWLSLTLKDLSKQPPVAGQAKVELSVVFLDLADAKKLNRTYRQRNYATDILSFEGEWPATANWGELVICPTVLKKQAKVHGHSFKAELGYMLIHGVLHLLGHDHEKSRIKADRMFQIQDQLFDRLRAKFEI